MALTKVPIPPKPTMLPEDARLTEVALKLKFLTGAEGWDTYENELDLMLERFIDRLIKCPATEHDYVRGIIEGLTLATNLPRNIMQKYLRIH